MPFETHPTAGRSLGRARRRPLRVAVVGSLAASAALTVAAPHAADASAHAAASRKEPVNACYSKDNTDPSVNVLTLSPQSVNVRKHAKKVNVVAKASDAGGPGKASGVAAVYVNIDTPTGSLNLQLKRHRPFTWSASQPIPRWSAPGAWDVSVVTVVDRAGNTRIITPGEFPPSFQTGFTVLSRSDTVGPRLGRLAIAKKRIKAGDKPVALSISARASDDKSGVAEVQVVAGRGASNEALAELTPVKGRPGLLRGLMQIPPDLGVAKWHVQAVNVYDRAGNRTSYDRAQAAMHGDHGFTLIAGADHQGPSMSGLRISSRRFDVRKKAKRLEVQLRAKDAKAGSQFADFELVDGNGQLAESIFMLPVGSGQHVDRHSVLWRGSHTFTPCHSAGGVYHVRIELFDAAANRTVLHRGTLRVLAHDRTQPTATLGFSQSINGPFHVTFNEAVDGITTDSLTVWSTTSPPVQQTVNQLTCTDAGGNPVDCMTGHVRAADLTPLPPLAPGSYDIVVNPEGVQQATDLAGNPFRQYSVLFGAS